MADAERKLWCHLRQLPADGTHFRRQATIGPYFVDFACHERKIVVEVDGGGHADDRQIRSDAVRTAFLNEHGYRVLRYWNSDVLSNVEGVMTSIYEALCERPDSRAPHP
jgi:very-short-patch-repair endonuclease